MRDGVRGREHERVNPGRVIGLAAAWFAARNLLEYMF